MPDRRRLLELEEEADAAKAEIIVLWSRIRRLSDEISTLKDDVDERVSQTAIDRYRDELPSETKLSLYPTGMRILWKNSKPSTFLFAVIAIAVVALALIASGVFRAH